MTTELFEPPAPAHRENPSDGAMRNCREVETSLAVCIRSIARATTARARLLASWELVNGLMTDNSLMGLEAAMDQACSIWFHPYTPPADLADCFDDDGAYVLRDGDDLHSEDAFEGLMEVIARMPNAAVRERTLACVVACVRREPMIDLWVGDILWFLQKAPHDYLIDWQDQGASTLAPLAAN